MLPTQDLMSATLSILQLHHCICHCILNIYSYWSHQWTEYINKPHLFIRQHIFSIKDCPFILDFFFFHQCDQTRAKGVLIVTWIWCAMRITSRIIPVGNAAKTSMASFSLTEQEPVTASHFHKCPIYLSGQLFSPEIPLSLGSQLKGVCMCCEGHNSCAGLLRGEAGLA